MALANLIDVNKVAVSIGAAALTGYASGEAIGFEFDDDDVEAVQGTNGSASAIVKHNNIGTLTLRLMQGNAFNGVLMTLLAASKAVGLKSYFVLVKDLNGNTMVKCAQGVITKQPAVKYGDSENVWEWTLKLFNPVVTGGINNPV